MAEDVYLIVEYPFKTGFFFMLGVIAAFVLVYLFIVLILLIFVGSSAGIIGSLF